MMCLKNFEIYAMIKFELDLISDVDTYLFFGKGMRGGFSYISESYNKASNKYLTF